MEINSYESIWSSLKELEERLDVEIYKSRPRVLKKPKACYSCKRITDLLKDNPNGLRPVEISRTLEMNPRTAYNHLRKLSKANIIYTTRETIHDPQTVYHLSSYDDKVK
jgi:hypothetical protein